MTVIVYAADERASWAQAALKAARAATHVDLALETLGSGALYRRLVSEASRPRADLVLTFGPFLAEAAARQGLLAPIPEAVKLPALPNGVPSAGARRLWATLDLAAFRIVGGAPPDISRLNGVDGGALAVPDPSRCEQGIMLGLALEARARQLEGSTDAAWTWWDQQAGSGSRFVESAAAALAAVRSQIVGSALVLTVPPGTKSQPIAGLAPMPNAAAIVKGSANGAEAGRVLQWLLQTGVSSLGSIDGAVAPGSADARSMAEAPPFDLNGAFEAYRTLRVRWLGRGYGPMLPSSGG